MDLQFIIAVNVIAVSLLLAAFALLQRQPGSAPWVGVNLAVAGVTTGALLAGWSWAGVVAAAVFVPFVLGPLVLGSIMVRRIQAGRTGHAAGYAKVLSFLVPIPGARFRAALFEAQAQPTLAERSAALRELARSATAEERVEIALLERRNDDDWAGVLRLLQDHPEVAHVAPELHVRALGECGKHEAMIEVFERRGAHAAGAALRVAQLVVLAFGGRTVGVEQMLAGPLAMLEEDNKAYWRAIAAKAAEPAAPHWRGALEHLAAAAKNETLRMAAARQLGTAAATRASQLSAPAAAVLDQIEGRLAAYERPARTGLLAKPVTLALLAGIFAMYAVEMQRGGTESLRTLVDLGALWPPFVLERGEWWRLLTALFLHMGPLHLGMNALLLYLLGASYEVRWGSLSLLIVFFGGGLISCGSVLWLMTAGVSQMAVLVGASGAIFAVFGSEVARSLVSWMRWRDAADKNALVAAGLAIAVQMVVDFTVPQISFAAHASGFVAGLAMGLASAALARPAGRA